MCLLFYLMVYLSIRSLFMYIRTSVMTVSVNGVLEYTHLSHDCVHVTFPDTLKGLTLISHDDHVPEESLGMYLSITSSCS